MATSAAPLVSIVTPVYNGAEFLVACIESVCAQTYSNWRYTILDNCSTDDGGAIAARYGARDARIRVVRNERLLPLIDNHNRALSLIEAESLYCKPLMADDCLAPECIELLVRCALARDTVGLVCSSTRIGPDRVLFECAPRADSPFSYLSGREAARAGLLGAHYFFGSPTTQLLRCDLIRKRVPFYNPDNLQADEEACYDLLTECDFGFVNRPLSYVRMHAGSHTAANYHLFALESCHVYALAKFGPVFLEPAELHQRLRQRLREYYRRLALGAVELRGAEFWAFHRRMLRLIGRPLSRARLAAAILRHVVRRLAAPAGLIRSLVQRTAALSRRRSGRPPPQAQ
jgi:glycosyltransferase involved in cell wall biosynthesis